MIAELRCAVRWLLPAFHEAHNTKKSLESCGQACCKSGLVARTSFSEATLRSALCQMKERAGALRLPPEARGLLDEALAARSEPAFVAMRRSLAQGIQALDAAVAWLLDAAIQDATLPLAAAGPVLELVGTVVGGHAVIAAALRAHAALAAGQGDRAFLLGQVDAARFYAANILPQAEALASSVTEGSAVVRELADASF